MHVKHNHKLTLDLLFDFGGGGKRIASGGKPVIPWVSTLVGGYSTDYRNYVQ